MFYIGLLHVACALAERKNVLMLIADDYRPNMGIYEDANDPFFTSPMMVTPNLDALASKSLVLTRAYTQYAMCGPSRNSFLEFAVKLRCWKTTKDTSILVGSQEDFLVAN